MQNNLNNLTLGAIAKAAGLPTVSLVCVIAAPPVILVPRLRRGSCCWDRQDCLRQQPVP